MNWFKTIAPIRMKLLVAFSILASITGIAALTAIIATGGDFIVTAITGLCTLAAAALGAIFRKAIADPYVATVVRMEGLAAGDLASQIAFTDYQDCVGRLTKAMFAFRDAAVHQVEQAEFQKEIVATLADRLSQLAIGDLTAEVTAEFPQEYAELKSNFNHALSSLRQLIGSVGESVSAIRTGSIEIAQASEDLARRTEGNAASLEETTAALVQIDDRLKTSAGASRSTVQRADQAIGTVSSGRELAGEATQAMERVSESAKGIDSVIQGVDKIAFQTRVLAMNAAVEAGRAGDAGRGFAVVADLVSALAMRAEEEAKRARDQLTITQTDIVTAVDAVMKVDGALVNIAGDVGEVHTLLGTMADDNAAQSTAITQITAAISSMDQSTQQNAAMVEETSAAAHNLTGEVNALADQAATFKVEADAGEIRLASKPASNKRANNAAKTARMISPAAMPPAMTDMQGFSAMQ